MSESTKSYRKGVKEFPFGYTPISEMNGEHADMLMDFGALRLAPGQVFEEDSNLNECAYLVVFGEVEMEWNGEKAVVKRDSFLDDGCYTLHVPCGSHVKFTGVADATEIMVMRTGNITKFDAKLYTPADIPDEDRMRGVLNNCANRIVRTAFDKTNAPWSNLVVGEVINKPGKWAGYPPHYHNQPEIYFYKMYPDNGYGHAEVGMDVYRVENNDTTFMLKGEQHGQAAAPGYAMWYLWVIRHLEGDPYGRPTDVEDQKWLLDPNAEFWGKEDCK
ncbi:5-deoxy-glucuronate isomerase [Anaerolentibacter hominis]|uniref:5-deoxy-glucuronate isomerase n=1 Tax=Anaerolentibacter hominis TaxID=3079009 RepID=UPI0031B7EAE6